MVNSSEQVAADAEQILDNAVHRGKPLQLGGRLEVAHLALALTGRLVRDLRAIVGILFRAVHHRRHHGAVRCRVAAQFVRDQSARLAALSFQQLAEEPLGRPLIASRLHEDVEYIAVFIDTTGSSLLQVINTETASISHQLEFGFFKDSHFTVKTILHFIAEYWEAQELIHHQGFQPKMHQMTVHYRDIWGAVQTIGREVSVGEIIINADRNFALIIQLIGQPVPKLQDIQDSVYLSFVFLYHNSDIRVSVSDYMR